jgi:hypothetical protein
MANDEKAEQATAGGRNIIEQATLFIGQAASVLQQELSAGIKAAESLEKRLIDVNRIRNKTPADVIQRTREDLHAALDIVMDLVSMSVRSLEGMTQRAISVSQTGGAESTNGMTLPGGLTMLKPASASRPGDIAEVSMALENAGDAPREIAGFHSSDLIGAIGHRIDGRNVTFEPTPLVIEPHGKARVAIRIAVPPDARPGSYAGVLIANQHDHVRAILTVDIN